MKKNRFNSFSPSFAVSFSLFRSFVSKLFANFFSSFFFAISSRDQHVCSGARLNGVCMFLWVFLQNDIIPSIKTLWSIATVSHGEFHRYRAHFLCSKKTELIITFWLWLYHFKFRTQFGIDTHTHTAFSWIQLCLSKKWILL